MKNNDKIGFYALIIVLLILAISLFYNTTKSCDINIDYDVTVDQKNMTSFPNLAEVKLACYNLCIKEVSPDYLRLCLEKCEKLE